MDIDVYLMVEIIPKAGEARSYLYTTEYKNNYLPLLKRGYNNYFNFLCCDSLSQFHGKISIKSKLKATVSNDIFLD